MLRSFLLAHPRAVTSLSWLPGEGGGGVGGGQEVMGEATGGGWGGHALGGGGVLLTGCLDGCVRIFR
jgi:hypothetical protein